MASTVSEPPLEVPQWLKSLPLAPEYYPTLAEFEDPISYILKIEKEASKYGICKIVPPLPPPPKKSILSNLNRSLSARNPNSRPTFTTRHQQIGFCPRRPRPVQRPVWQSGENYTVQEFEAKAKQFEKIHLKKTGKRGFFSPLEIEYFFWKASVDKPFTVEYANDMPGSAFVPVNVKKWRETGEGATVGESAWNMRGVSRSNGSLLRFMKDEIPGVTSPMVYIAMLFSWFAWHVEDHDLHSLNYMHMGAAKTWYGVPRDAALAFQEVIRVHGYGGEVNQLVTFATLGEKTTVMSPEVLIGAGIPCCRLVQNVGEFVVTFPGAYHSGFSHGFNCGEAANIATPEWLRFAKEAAIRRASINFPPMVSHFQLLYDLTQTLCSRVSIGTEPRSSRLKEKRRGEGEMIVKDFFVRSVIENNYLLYELLGQGLSCVVVPRNLSHISISQDFNVGSQRKVKPRLPLSLYGNNKAPEDSIDLLSDDDMLHRNLKANHLTSLHSVNRKPKSMYERDMLASSSIGADQHGSDEMCTSTPLNPKPSCEKESGHGLLDQGLFSCVTCGILSYACAAVIQPRDTAVRYFMSAGYNYFNDWNDGSGEQYTVSNGNENTSETNYNSRAIESSCQDDLYDVPVQSGDYEVNVATEKVDVEEHTGVQKDIPALDLLAFAYGDSADSDEEHGKTEMPADGEQEEELSRYPHDPLSTSKFLIGDSQLHSLELDGQNEASEKNPHSLTKEVCRNQITACYSRRNSSNMKRRWPDSSDKGKDLQTSAYSFEADMVSLVPEESNCLKSSCSDTGVLSVKVTTGSSELYDNDLYMERIQSGPATSSMPNSSLVRSNYFQAASFGETTKYSSVDISVKNTSMPLVQRSDEDTLRKHVFCLEHAMEVEKQLRPVGGAIMLLLCHPEYPKVESEAKLLAEELGIDYDWNDIVFKEANKEEREIIRAALDDEEAIPGNGDWAVKLGINLYYSANLSRSPLYTKQMPYNSIIYKAFGCSSLADSPMKDEVGRKAYGKQKKIVVAGKWCGKVWMSNQVHPFLVQRTNGEEDKSIGFQAREVPRLEPSSRPDRKAKLSHQFVRVTPSSWSSRKTKLSYAQRYTQEEEDDALGLHTRPVPCLKSSSKRHSKLEKNVESSHAQRDTEEEEDDIGFHARAVPCLRPHPRPGRKAKLSHQFERVTPSTKWHFKLESTVETCHVQRDAQEEEEEAEEDSIGFYGRASMGFKPSLRPQRKVEAGHQFERVTPSSKRRSKHEKKVDTSHAQRESQENEKEVEDEDEEGGGVDEDEDSMGFGSRAIPCQKPSSRSQRKAEVSHQSERVKPNSKVKRKVEISRIFDRVMPSFSRTPKLEREVEISHQFEEPLPKYSSGETTAVAREIGKKRKRKVENGASKRPKSPSVDNQIDATEAEDSSESDYLSLGRVLRSRQPKTPMLRRNSAKKDQQCDSNLKEETDGGPSTRLRRRPSKPSVDEKLAIVKKAKEARRAKKAPACSNEDDKDEEAEYQCNVDGCTMGFCTKQELMWHKRNICSVKGCGKKFFSHKYLVQHRRVHLDDRPLKCPWKGCKMTFKWAWARTEHIRVHTGARPYVCREKGCGQTFRFVSDFSRHKRRTGHSVKGRT